MIFQTKSWILLSAAALALCAAACSPKATEPDTAVTDANVGDLAVDVVIPPTDSAIDLADATAAAEIAEVDDGVGGAEIVDVVIPMDEITDADETADSDPAKLDQSEVADTADTKSNDTQLYGYRKKISARNSTGPRAARYQACGYAGRQSRKIAALA